MSGMERQMAERRERILAAAREIIAEHGYAGLTMRSLASASRVTVPTIYNLIGSKEAVLFAAVEEQTQRFAAGLVRGQGDVLGIIDATARELLRVPHYYRTLLQILFASDAASAARRTVSEALTAEFDAALCAIEAKGELQEFVDRVLLRERLQSHLQMTALEWAGGLHSASAFRALLRWEAAMLLAAATCGEQRAEFERQARSCQPEAQVRGRRGKARVREVQA